MITRRRLRLSQIFATCALVLACAAAHAQSWPSRPVTLVVPQAPGGANDRAARLLAEKLQETWRQSVLVDFKPGGGVVVGTQYVARAQPDGHTMGIISSSHATNPSLRKDLPYDTLKDFAFIARIGFYVMGVVAHPSLPAKDIRELVALIKQNPGRYEFGSNGIGTAAHLGGELLKSTAGLDMVHIPYNGGAPLYRDMVGGRVPVAIAIMGSAMPYVEQGRMKVLGLTNPKRSQLYPNYGLVSDVVPGFEMTTWIGLVAPAATPASTVQKMTSDVLKATENPALRDEFAKMGLEMAPLPPPQFEAFIREEMQRIGQVVQKAGITLK